ncbi:kelch domain-containing protein 7A [Lissotriton helveticus]
MITLSWETAAQCLDMPLAGKLALSAAATALLLALVFRFFKSREAGKTEPSGPARGGRSGTIAGTSSDEKKNSTQTELSRDGSSQDGGLRFRHTIHKDLSLSDALDDEPGGCSDGAITTETRRANNKSHQRDGCLAGEARGLEITLTALQLQSCQELMVDGKTGVTRASPSAEFIETSVVAGGPENRHATSDPVLTDRASGPTRNPAETPEEHILHSDGQTSQASSLRPLSMRLQAEVTDLRSHEDEDCRDGMEGAEINRNQVLTKEAGSISEGGRTTKASSGMGLLVNQSNAGGNGVYSFSSIAEIQVEEGYVKGNIAEDGQCLEKSLPGSLKGKVYHYFVESTSESVSRGKSCTTEPGGKRSSFLHHKVHKKHSNSLSEAHQHPSPEMPGFKEHETKTCSSEISSSVDHNWSLQSVRPSEFQEKLSSRDPQKDLGPQEDSTKADIMKQLTESKEQGLKSDVKSNPVPINRTDTTPQSLDGHSPGATGEMQQPLDPSQAKTTPTFSADCPTDLTFFQGLLNSQSNRNSCLDLRNCYAALKVAKEHQLVDLREAAYRFMSDNYLQVLQSPAIYGHLNPVERELILDRRMSGRKFITVADVDTQTYALPSSRSSSRLCYYDDKSKSWHTISCLPPEAVNSGCAVGTMFNYLFVVAGCEGLGRQKKPSKSVFCYNPLTGIWKEVSPLNQARPHCKLVELQGYLYAIGGECQHTVEQYDPRRDRWNFATPLPNDTFAIAHMATVCEDKIYVTGGTLRYMLLSYDPKDKVWKSSLISGSRDRTTEMVAVGSFLYRFDLNRSMGISVHRCNVRARLWYECATRRMPYPASFQCAVIGSYIHCLSRQFHLRFLAHDVSPQFLDVDLEGLPSPRGGLYPFVLMLPKEECGRTEV